MALATQCPHCHTTFRVASDQLKLRGGIVRCGACQSIFDGSAHLIDLDALAAGKDETDAAAPAAHESESAPNADALAGEAQATPVDALDSAPAFDAPASLPAATAEQDHAAASGAEPALTASTAEPAPESAAEPAPAALAYGSQDRIEPGFGLPVDEELVARPLPGDEHTYQDEPERQEAAEDASVGADGRMRAPAHDVPLAALPLRASAAASDTLPLPAAPSPAARSARAKAVEARTRRSRLTPTDIAAPKLRVPASAEADEPEFVKRSRKLEASGRTRRLLMIAGAVILALLLASQLLLGFHNVLAARYPAAKPVLAAGCALLGCRIGLPAQAENLAIETGELTTLGVDTYSLNTLLRNQGSLVQAWPSIQLELTDANDKPVLRRVFGPADYLPHGVSAAAGFAARSEQPVRLNFVLTELKPSGYHIAVFYP
jgi:predicted Zn finger-like uncharacterized protein